MEELRSMKINEKNVLKVKQSTFLASCLHCWCDINSEDDLNTYSTVGCLLKLCFKSHVIIILTKIVIARNVKEQVLLYWIKAILYVKKKIRM